MSIVLGTMLLAAVSGHVSAPTVVARWHLLVLRFGTLRRL